MDLIIYIIICGVSLIASTIGAICGIGGGIIIKPAIDATGVVNVAAGSFLSGCVVLVMSTYSVVMISISKQSKIAPKIATPLAIGAVIGGIIGQNLFQYIKGFFENPDKIGAIQALILLVITLCTLLFTLKKDTIHSFKFSSIILCIMLGIFLGIISSFLGIGGGPINLIVFFYFFSMSVKTATQNSLYIIFFSQISSLIMNIISGKVPKVGIELILLMSVCGLLGGIIGGKLYKRLSEKSVKLLFIILMILILIINAINFFKFI